ncbi:MAG: DUF4160 domain-containing protein [Nitrospira sp.]|nr:DUF4160 domain-containing protein [Nitrospira sp.]
MPTILQILGWRFFFYANEANEPPHVHARKAEKEWQVLAGSRGLRSRRGICLSDECARYSRGEKDCV